MNEMNQPYLRQIRNALVFMAIILLGFIMKTGMNVLLPIVIAVFIFVMVNPILNKMDKLKVPKFLSLIAILAIVVLVAGALLYTVIVMVNMLLSKLPYYSARVQMFDEFISNHVALFFDEEPGSFSVLGLLNVDWLGLAIGTLSSFSTKIIDILKDCMLIFVYLLFLLMERHSFMPKLLSAFPHDKAERFAQLGMKMNRQMSKYIFLKIGISAATGVMFYLVAVLTGLDFALVWGVLAFILNFIPTIGSIIVTGGTILMAMIQFMPNWGMIVYIALMMTSIEMILGNVIDPKLQGVQLNISPVVILISLALWGYIWGLIGMFLAVPLTCIIQIVCANIPSLKNVAIFLSTGKFLRQDHEESGKKGKKKKKNEKEETGMDIEMPYGRNPEREEDPDQQELDFSNPEDKN